MVFSLCLLFIKWYAGNSNLKQKTGGKCDLNLSKAPEIKEALKAL